MSFADRYAGYRIPWGFNGLGEVTYQRTYARTKADGTLETYPETIDRVLQGLREIQVDLDHEELDRLGKYHLDLKCAVMSRGLWVFGTEMVRAYGAAALLNCYGTAIRRPSDIQWVMDQLMVGGGVGFSIEPQYIEQFEPVSGGEWLVFHTDEAGPEVFVVPDTRQGWSECIRRVIEHAIAGSDFKYSTCALRPAGVPLKTFGGHASGPQALIDAVDDIARILGMRRGLKLRPIDVLDICNVIGRCVVMGSARRSAEIAVGSFADTAFRNAKMWSLGNVPGWRGNSNNSAVANSFEEIPEDYWTTNWDGSGELLGLLNMHAARTMGRSGEKADDHYIVVFNPCGEIGLADKEPCNLASIALPHVEGYEELLDIIYLLYHVQKKVALLTHPSPETQAVMNANTRLGMSFSGIMDATPEQREWLYDAYSYLKELDIAYSRKIGVAPSIKLTAEKPDGTIALMFGVSPGINANWSHHYIRRIRINAISPLLPELRARGYRMEPERDLAGNPVGTEFVVEFPVELPEHCITADQQSAIDQLDWCLWAQRVWADNAVSTTVTYRDDEVPAIRDWMSRHWHEMKCVSWLRYAEHGFALAPYEAITKEQYDAEVARLNLHASVTVYGSEIEDLDDACAGGACPIR